MLQGCVSRGGGWRPALLVALLLLLAPLAHASSSRSAQEQAGIGGRAAFGCAARDGSQDDPNATAASPAAAPCDCEHQREAEEQVAELRASWKLFVILAALVFCTLAVHLMKKLRFHALPESVAVIGIGAVLGFALKMSGEDWSGAEQLDPTTFFLVLLPPIIFESGYSLHKGDFFRNFGTILLFAIVGTAINAIVMGGCLYGLGMLNLVYRLSAAESFAFGSLISAVDPVATLAIFNALDVDPLLSMLVFGESVLNDAIAIVMTQTVLDIASSTEGSGAVLLHAVRRFLGMALGSAGIGILFGIISALVLKHCPAPRPGARVCHALPHGVRSVRLCGGAGDERHHGHPLLSILMAHYTHYNLSPMTQITTQVVFRTISFMAETAVFAYLGLAIFAMSHVWTRGSSSPGETAAAAARASRRGSM